MELRGIYVQMSLEVCNYSGCSFLATDLFYEAHETASSFTSFIFVIYISYCLVVCWALLAKPTFPVCLCILTLGIWKINWKTEEFFLSWYVFFFFC